MDILDTKPSTMPLSANVTIPDMFVKIRFVKLRNPLAEKLKPLPKPISTSA